MITISAEVLEAAATVEQQTGSKLSEDILLMAECLLRIKKEAPPAVFKHVLNELRTNVAGD